MSFRRAVLRLGLTNSASDAYLSRRAAPRRSWPPPRFRLWRRARLGPLGIERIQLPLRLGRRRLALRGRLLLGFARRCDWIGLKHTVSPSAALGLGSQPLC